VPEQSATAGHELLDLGRIATGRDGDKRVTDCVSDGGGCVAHRLDQRDHTGRRNACGEGIRSELDQAWARSAVSARAAFVDQTCPEQVVESFGHEARKHTL
jgi:hypothetical protein